MSGWWSATSDAIPTRITKPMASLKSANTYVREIASPSRVHSGCADRKLLIWSGVRSEGMGRPYTMDSPAPQLGGIPSGRWQKQAHESFCSAPVLPVLRSAVPVRRRQSWSTTNPISWTSDRRGFPVVRGSPDGHRRTCDVRCDQGFPTHMHSDHTLGLGELMLAPWMFGREEPLEIYGPHGTAAMASAVATAYSSDVAKRTHNEPHTDRGHEITGRDIVPGIVYADDLVEIEAFGVQHGEWDTAIHGPFPALGYRITTPIASWSSPATPFRSQRWQVGIPAVTSSSTRSTRRPPLVPPSGVEAYHSISHTSATYLGRVASDANPDVLALNHQLLWHATEG